ncbi:MAG: helix-turn-helix transcriptional regulator [Proteobacteria bacterium]|nr:helix-turn-helix transcriptional regulator [Pseudomonadota bacterium]
MGASEGYGKAFGSKFGLEHAPVVISRALRKAQIAVTEVGDTDPHVGPTREIAREDAYLIGLQLRDYPGHVMWEDGRAARKCDLRAGEATIYDLKRNPVVQIDKPFHSIHFYIPRAVFVALEEDAESAPVGELAYVPGAGVTDETLRHLGLSLRPALLHPEHSSALFVDHATLAVATHVAHTYGHLSPPSDTGRGRLAPWQARRAMELLNANLDGGLSIRALAQECGLSVGHFSRAFRGSLGMAPHRWLLQRRIERARSLLLRGQLTLSEVALAAGFADQSHFTRMFTREVGCAPGAWRRRQRI